MKMEWREVRICLQEIFEALWDVQKNAFDEFWHDLLNTADCISHKRTFFSFK